MKFNQNYIRKIQKQLQKQGVNHTEAEVEQIVQYFGKMAEVYFRINYKPNQRKS